jgi:hypothetical protein
MEKETIADLCERLRKTNDKGYFYCDQLAENWDIRCGDMGDCGECRKKLSTSIADRIEAAHQREMAGSYEKNPDGLPAGLTISPDGTLLDWEGENYVLQSIVRDVEREPNGNMAGDGKCHVTQYDTGDDSTLCYGCGACGYGWHVSKNDKPFTYCPNCGREVVYLTIVTEDDEDTRESLEEDVHVWCALYPAWTHAGEFRDKVLGWLDRQATITEREVMNDMQRAGHAAVEVERKIRDELRVKADRLTEENEIMRQALRDLENILE